MRFSTTVFLMLLDKGSAEKPDIIFILADDLGEKVFLKQRTMEFFLQASMMLVGTTQVHQHHTWTRWQRRGSSWTQPTPSPSVHPPELPS